MPKFTVRVELEKASGTTYDELHGIMYDHKFKRTYKDSSGKTWLLPTAEYIGDYDGSAQNLAMDVQDWAEEETSHDKKVMVIATEHGDFGHEGLDRAPVYHRQASSIPGVPFCTKKTISAALVIKDRAAAIKKIRTQGGLVCLTCYPKKKP
jgi:hypothetical protein